MRYCAILVFLCLCFQGGFAQSVSKKRLGFVPYTDPDFAEAEYREIVYKTMYESALRIFINTQRFVILDRGSFNILKLEKDFQKGEDLINSEIIAQGKILAAEILGIAKITNLSVELNGDGKTYSAFIVCEFKQVDVESGKAVSALQLEGSTKDLIGKKPTTAEEAISRSIKKMEKDLEKWVREKFPLAMNILEVNEEELYLVAEGGNQTGLTRAYKLRAVKVKTIEGKKVATTLGKLTLTSEGLGEETTRYTINDKLEWQNFLAAWKSDPSSILVFEDNR